MRSSFNDKNGNNSQKGSCESRRPKSGIQLQHNVRPLIFRYGSDFKNKSTAARHERITKQLLQLRKKLQNESNLSHLHLTSFFKQCGYSDQQIQQFREAELVVLIEQILEFKTLPSVSSLKEFVDLFLFNKLRKNKVVRRAPEITVMPQKAQTLQSNVYYDLHHGKNDKFVKRYDIQNVKHTGRTFKIIDDFINSQQVRMTVDPDPVGFQRLKISGTGQALVQQIDNQSKE